MMRRLSSPCHGVGLRKWSEDDDLECQLGLGPTSLGWPGTPNPNYICRSRSQARWRREFQRDTARFSQKLLARKSPECVAVFRLRGGWVSGLRMRLGHIWFSTLHYPRQADREGRAFTRLAYD